MEKIIFKDFPDMTTPLNADNLNQLQTNVENALGSIVESGSNSNGYWIKYSDGTMICTGTGSGTNGGSTTKTFAQTFINIPTVIGLPTQSPDNYFIGLTVRNIKNSTAVFTVFYVQFGTNSWGLGSNTFNYVAIGRWK